MRVFEWFFHCEIWFSIVQFNPPSGAMKMIWYLCTGKGMCELYAYSWDWPLLYILFSPKRVRSIVNSPWWTPKLWYAKVNVSSPTIWVSKLDGTKMCNPLSDETCVVWRGRLYRYITNPWIVDDFELYFRHEGGSIHFCLPNKAFSYERAFMLMQKNLSRILWF